MPISIANRSTGVDLRLENSDDVHVTAALALLSVRNEEHRMRLEEKSLDDALRARQHQREQEARDTEIERLRLQSAENERNREHEEAIQRRNQEHEREMRRLELEGSNSARENDLRLNLGTQETRRLELESLKKNEDLEICKLQRLVLQLADNSQARELNKRMTEFEVEISSRYEQLEIRRREDVERDTRSLRNLGLVATGVGAASGAIGGALGATAAVGLAAGAVVGAATVLAPVSGAIAFISGAGYVCKKAASVRSDRA